MASIRGTKKKRSLHIATKNSLTTAGDGKRGGVR